MSEPAAEKPGEPPSPSPGSILASPGAAGEWLERHGIAELGAELGDTDI